MVSSAWISPMSWCAGLRGAAGISTTDLKCNFHFMEFLLKKSCSMILSLLDHFYFLQNDHHHYQMGGGCRPMEPKSTIWQPHCYLLQRQGGYSSSLHLYKVSCDLICVCKVEVYQWTEGDFVVDEPIKGHTRQVTPECFSPCHYVI